MFKLKPWRTSIWYVHPSLMVFRGSLRAGCSGIVAPLLKRTLWIWEPKGHNTAATHYPKVVLQDHHPTASYQKSSGWCPQPVAVAKKRRYSKRRPESSEPLRSCVVVPGSRVKVNGEESAKDWPSDKFNSFWRWVFAKRDRERERERGACWLSSQWTRSKR